MEPVQTAQLRALARWHTSRRAVDELVVPLLDVGPMAVQRVSDRLAQLEHLLREERSAFDAFAALVPRVPRQDAVVIDLFGQLSTADRD